MKNLWNLFSVAALLSASVAMADPVACTGTAHTLHVITTNKNASCVLSKLFETQEFCIVDASGKEISGVAFNVTPAAPTSFGMILSDDGAADFNMEYALTCVSSDGNVVQSPKVMFTIGADGPADPNVSVVNLYGAKGAWQATGAGENYSLTF
jgi:hypothetical protein